MRNPVKVALTTLTVDHPNAGITTTVHPDEQSALDSLASLWEHMDLGPVGPQGVVQELCDSGYVIYIEDHQVEIENGGTK
jgi:hypothetical protein